MTNGQYVLADIDISGLATIILHDNPNDLDLLDVMNGSFASFTGTQHLQTEASVMIPEPASAAGLAGLGALGLVATRRRRA
jgi:PEP-CTERM putative exosortase interaction domain/Deltaproteobacterial GC-motif protein sorting domain